MNSQQSLEFPYPATIRAIFVASPPFAKRIALIVIRLYPGSSLGAGYQRVRHASEVPAFVFPYHFSPPMSTDRRISLPFLLPQLPCFQLFCKGVRKPLKMSDIKSLPFQMDAHSLAASLFISTLLQNRVGGVCPRRLRPHSGRGLQTRADPRRLRHGAPRVLDTEIYVPPSGSAVGVPVNYPRLVGPRVKS